MAVNPIETKIINKIKTLIPLMTIANGYSRNFGSVDEDTPANIVFPATWLEYPEDEPLDEELSVIERDTVYLGLMLRVWLNTAANLDEEMGEINADFSKMFADNEGDLQTEGLIKADYAGANKTFRLVTAHPAEIIISYILMYRWQKKYPYQT